MNGETIYKIKKAQHLYYRRGQYAELRGFNVAAKLFSDKEDGGASGKPSFWKRHKGKLIAAAALAGLGGLGGLAYANRDKIGGTSDSNPSKRDNKTQEASQDGAGGQSKDTEMAMVRTTKQVDECQRYINEELDNGKKWPGRALKALDFTISYIESGGVLSDTSKSNLLYLAEHTKKLLKWVDAETRERYSPEYDSRIARIKGLPSVNY